MTTTEAVTTTAAPAPTPATESSSKPSATSAAQVRASETLPDLKAYKDLKILDSDGKERQFVSLFAGPDPVLLIFIRHFFCGLCSAYITEISNTPSLSPDSVSPVKVVVIGCGSPSRIAHYKAETGPCPYDIYTDPSGTLHDALGFVKTLKQGEKRPSWIKQGVLAMAVKGAVHAIKGGVTGGGRYDRNGGEIMAQNGEVRWISRMKDTWGHISIAELEALVKNWGKV